MSKYEDTRHRRAARSGLSQRSRVAVYARVSTDEQAREGDSINQQTLMCLERLEATLGQSGLGPFAWEEAPKGKHRPQLWRLIQGLYEDLFTHVCAYRVDRLYRRIEGGAAFRNLLFEEHGVEALFVAER